MELGLTNEGGGEFIRFKPRDNVWVLDGEETNLKGFILDPSSLKTGWGLIQAGEAPDWQWDQNLGVKGQKPEGDYKRGFAIDVFVKDFGWREWSSNGFGVNKGFQTLWGNLQGGIAENKDKCVQVICEEAVNENLGKGRTTRIPMFKIGNWVESPKMAEQTTQKSEPIAENIF
jgi:hypothetical protein